MQNKKSFLPVFLFFLILSLFILFISRIPFFSKLDFFSTPLFSLENGIFQVVHLPSIFFTDKKYQALEEANLALQNQLVQMDKLKEDNAALRDQFETAAIPTSSLLPAQVIGDPQFIPGITSPEVLILDKGSSDGVSKGDVVVYKNNLVGIISSITSHASGVTLVSNTATSFTARDMVTDAQGVLVGQGSGVMVLGNVLLSEKLQVGDLVVTSGSRDVSGKGIAPGLVVGKIVFVAKNPSSLYQSASVQSLLHMEKLTTVFVITK